MKLQQKKGLNLNMAASAVIMVVLIAVLVIVAIYMLSSLGSSFPGTSAAVQNETGAFLNSSGYTLANSTVCAFASPSITTIYNGSTLLAAGNYTLTGNVLTNATAVNYLAAKVTYSYLWGGQACNAATTTITNFSGYPALVGLVGTIIFLALVIGVLMGSFAFGGRKSA